MTRKAIMVIMVIVFMAIAFASAQTEPAIDTEIDPATEPELMDSLGGNDLGFSCDSSKEFVLPICGTDQVVMEEIVRLNKESQTTIMSKTRLDEVMAYFKAQWKAKTIHFCGERFPWVCAPLSQEDCVDGGLQPQQHRFSSFAIFTIKKKTVSSSCRIKITIGPIKKNTSLPQQPDVVRDVSIGDCSDQVDESSVDCRPTLPPGTPAACTAKYQPTFVAQICGSNKEVMETIQEYHALAQKSKLLGDKLVEANIYFQKQWDNKEIELCTADAPWGCSDLTQADCENGELVPKQHRYISYAVFETKKVYSHFPPKCKHLETEIVGPVQNIIVDRLTEGTSKFTPYCYQPVGLDKEKEVRYCATYFFAKIGMMEDTCPLVSRNAPGKCPDQVAAAKADGVVCTCADCEECEECDDSTSDDSSSSSSSDDTPRPGCGGCRSSRVSNVDVYNLSGRNVELNIGEHGCSSGSRPPKDNNNHHPFPRISSVLHKVIDHVTP